MSTVLEDLLASHVERGTIPGAVALSASPEGEAGGEPEIVAVGSAAVDGPAMRGGPVDLLVSEFQKVPPRG
jgi:hypothetical protein